MASVKARKQGNSIMITLPRALGVQEGENFFILKNNGAITLIPKVKDHFVNVTTGEYYMPEKDVGFCPSGGELDQL